VNIMNIQFVDMRGGGERENKSSHLEEKGGTKKKWTEKEGKEGIIGWGKKDNIIGKQKTSEL